MGGGRVSVAEMVIKNDILGTVILTDVAYVVTIGPFDNAKL